MDETVVEAYDIIDIIQMPYSSSLNKLMLSIMSLSEMSIALESIGTKYIFIH